MKVERVLYGMQTSDGKIWLRLTDGARELLTQKSLDYLRQLRPKDSGKYLWFKTEQTIAYPIVYTVQDKDPEHGGRTWVQNQTFLVGIHDFLTHYLNNGANPFGSLVLPELEEFPEFIEPLNI